MNEEFYESQVMLCSFLQKNNASGINANDDCLEWVLTEQGNQRIAEYMHFKLYGE